MALSMLIKKLVTAAGKEEFNEYVKKVLGWTIGLIREHRAVELINDTDVTLHQKTSTCSFGNFTDAPDGIIKPRSIEVYGTRTGATGSFVGLQVYSAEIDGKGVQIGIGMQYGAWIQPIGFWPWTEIYHLLKPNSIIIALAPEGQDLNESKYWTGGSSKLYGYNLTGHWGDKILEFTLIKLNN